MSSPDQLPFREALKFWWKLGWISFGGPAGQISIMHQEIVEKKKWLDESHFMHALNFCMLLPGPEAQQLATYLGWRLYGIRGAIAAGALFIIPAVFILMLLSWIYMAFGNVPAIQGIFHGLEPAVIAVVCAAVIKIGKKSLKTPTLWGIATAAFIGIFFLKISFVIIILSAGLIGLAAARYFPRQIPASQGHGDPSSLHDSDLSHPLPAVVKATWKRAFKVIATGLAIWLLPILAIGIWLGWTGVHFQQGLFFSRAAMITFGGAYAVLPYVAQQAVEHHGWLTDAQMITGLGLAESTPGPLVIVLEFIGFVGGWQHPPAGWSPMASAILGALLTVWATFVPCFIFIILGGPYVEVLRERPTLANALSAITAAVVGVILNLAVVFTIVAIQPEDGNWDIFTIILAIFTFIGMNRFKIGLIPTLLTCAIAGYLYSLIA